MVDVIVSNINGVITGETLSFFDYSSLKKLAPLVAPFIYNTVIPITVKK